ncbi:hypothetical protein EYR40_006406 [Pleurotus pulmonarius]|nr:hypothetical protein EYR36_011027 [Pleurotus pulmonarius]KAF4599314.1 hypothetical protein EYR40_006406 [Pleurotus pulmonarius]
MKSMVVEEVGDQGVEEEVKEEEEEEEQQPLVEAEDQQLAQEATQAVAEDAIKQAMMATQEQSLAGTGKEQPSDEEVQHHSTAEVVKENPVPHTGPPPSVSATIESINSDTMSTNVLISTGIMQLPKPSVAHGTDIKHSTPMKKGEPCGGQGPALNKGQANKKQQARAKRAKKVKSEPTEDILDDDDVDDNDNDSGSTDYFSKDIGDLQGDNDNEDVDYSRKLRENRPKEHISAPHSNKSPAQSPIQLHSRNVSQTQHLTALKDDPFRDTDTELPPNIVPIQPPPSESRTSKKRQAENPSHPDTTAKQARIGGVEPVEADSTSIPKPRPRPIPLQQQPISEAMSKSSKRRRDSGDANHQAKQGHPSTKPATSASATGNNNFEGGNRWRGEDKMEHMKHSAKNDRIRYSKVDRRDGKTRIKDSEQCPHPTEVDIHHHKGDIHPDAKARDNSIHREACDSRRKDGDAKGHGKGHVEAKDSSRDGKWHNEGGGDRGTRRDRKANEDVRNKGSCRDHKEGEEVSHRDDTRAKRERSDSHHQHKAGDVNNCQRQGDVEHDRQHRDKHRHDERRYEKSGKGEKELHRSHQADND